MAAYCHCPWRTLGAVSFSDSGSVWLSAPELLLWHEVPYGRADRASLILQSSVYSFTALATRPHFHLVLHLHEMACHAESFVVLFTGEPKKENPEEGVYTATIAGFLQLPAIFALPFASSSHSFVSQKGETKQTTKSKEKTYRQTEENSVRRSLQLLWRILLWEIMTFYYSNSSSYLSLCSPN